MAVNGNHAGDKRVHATEFPGWSSAPIGPIRLYCPDLSTGQCEAWDKTATHVWDFDASSNAFPDIVAPVNGWVPLLTANKWPDKTLPRGAYDLAGFLNLETGERTGGRRH